MNRSLDQLHNRFMVVDSLFHKLFT